MIYKHALAKTFLLLMCITVSGCSHFPILLGGENTANKTTTATQNVNSENLQNTSQDHESQSDVATQNDAAIAPPTPQNILLAQALHSQSDLFKASRRSLSPAVKAKVAGALKQFNAGEFAASEASMNNILTTTLNLTSGVYVLAGDIALANKKPDQAIDHYKTALNINEYNAMAANRLGVQLREQGKFVLAEAYYTQAINAQPSMANSYRNRAVLYDLYLNQKRKALDDYNTYAALLEYSLAIQAQLHDSANTEFAIQTSVYKKPLSEAQIKEIKHNINLAQRWTADVGRQIEALQRMQNNNTTGNE